LTSPEQLKR